MTTTAHALEEELRFYYAEKPNLLRDHPGRFVLINGDKLLGVFDTEESAVEAGLRMVGPSSFLVKQVLESDPVHFSTLELGRGLDVGLPT